MGRVKEAFLCPPDDRDSPWEPTDDELEAMASEYFASISPKPIPCDPTEEDPCLDAWGLLVPEILAEVVARNAEWLQWTNRTTSEALSALFVNVNYAGMNDIQAYMRLSTAIHDAGFSPSNQSPNPTWTFPV